MPILSMAACSPGSNGLHHIRYYDYCLKFLLVGDADVGKKEILNLLDGEQFDSSPFYPSIAPKTTAILLEGKKVKLQLWDTSGQGRFSTIIRSYSRGAQGILVVFDITNHWSFEGINRWLREIDEQAPGVPKILIGNRLHLEFRRQVSRDEAEHFARKKNMEYFEVSTLALFNICESLTELSRLVLTRNGMERLWKNSKVLSLQELCCRTIAPMLNTVHDIDRLPLPPRLQFELKSFADSDQLTAVNSNTLRRQGRTSNNNHNSNYHTLNNNGGPSISLHCCSAHKRTTSDLNSNGSFSLRNTFSSSPFIAKLTNRHRRATVALAATTLAPPMTSSSLNDDNSKNNSNSSFDSCGTFPDQAGPSRRSSTPSDNNNTATVNSDYCRNLDNNGGTGVSTNQSTNRGGRHHRKSCLMM